MSWVEGFSTCSQLGVDGCVVWWDAWAAIGTISAVVTALTLAGAESRRRKRDAYGRSMWIAISIRPGLVGWLSRIAEFREALDGKGDDDRVSLIHQKPHEFLKPPDTIIEMRLDIPALGRTAEPFAQGTFLLTEVLADWEELNAALHGSVLEPEASAIIANAKQKIGRAYNLIQKVEDDVCARLKQPRLARISVYVAGIRKRRRKAT